MIRGFLVHFYDELYKVLKQQDQDARRVDAGLLFCLRGKRPPHQLASVTFSDCEMNLECLY